jgi:hypothetical protein
MISNSGSDPDFRFWPTALRMSSGVLVWAAHFTVVYGFTALACARGFGGAAPWVVGVATLVAAAAAVLVLLTHLSQEFTRWITAALAAAALLAILWEGLPALLLPNPCA